MMPVNQTRLSSPDGTTRGNCLAACIASLLELRIEDVPPFEDLDRKWFTAMDKFLFDNGYEFLGTCYEEKDLSDKRYNTGVDGFLIVYGDSFREYVKNGHAVIYKNCKMVHDPHPEKNGIKKFKGFYMIEKINQGGKIK